MNKIRRLRASELEAFDETKSGVKGIVDAGIKPRRNEAKPKYSIVEKVRNASKRWGFFQVLNHGIPMNVMEGMKDGAPHQRLNGEIRLAPYPPKTEELPAVFRDIMVEYSKQVMNLGYFLFELLSEALVLDPDYL
ncbi:hypothetical protein F3Y22_tig00110600pilonHSYRG00076 [Hibiscus syriacus]|uniref:Non-haem dioxygenase N-terminal domain-containing protein n=1 Tax=Hibiscus syriacus TaxID=106335 RepID=A0A6A3A3L8_HIBSY|nr:hypothetical protein F3Y22_tig00110600pilonHSYRG00076 [Hibiscus syriacus]